MLQSIEINLLQMRPKEVEPSRIIPVLLFVLTVVLLGVMGWRFVDISQHIREAQAGIEAADTRIAELQAELGTYQNMGSTDTYLEMPSMIRSNYWKPSEVLATLTPLLPQDANLSSLMFVDGSAIKVTGLFASVEDVVAFMQAVKQSETFHYISSGGMLKVEHQTSGGAASEYLPAVQATFDIEPLRHSEQGG